MRARPIRSHQSMVPAGVMMKSFWGFSGSLKTLVSQPSCLNRHGWREGQRADAHARPLPGVGLPGLRDGRDLPARDRGREQQDERNQRRQPREADAAGQAHTKGGRELRHRRVHVRLLAGADRRPARRPSARSIACRSGAGEPDSLISPGSAGFRVSSPQPRHPQAWQRWRRFIENWRCSRSMNVLVRERRTRFEPQLGQLSMAPILPV